MSRKQLISLAALTFILQACGDSKDEKNLKRRNKELTQQNNELAQAKDKVLAERSAELTKAQQELDATKETLNKAKEEKASAEAAKKKLEIDLAAQSTTTATLSKQLKDTEAAIEAKEEQLKNLRTIAAAYDANVQRLNGQIADLQKEADTLKGERDTLKTSLTDATEATAKIKAELEAKLGVKDELITTKDAEITKLNEQINLLTNSPESLAAEISALTTKLKSAEDVVKILGEEREALKASLAEATTAAANTKAELEAQLAAKDKVILDKDAQITALNAQVASLGNSTDLANAQAEVAKLKEERDTLKTAIAKAEATTEKAQQDVLAANKKIAALESSQAGILKKSLEDIRGLWLNQYKIKTIASGACYEFTQLSESGSFTQGVACSDGRVQMQKHSFERFSAQAIPVQDDIDYTGSYGLVVDGVASSSTCQDPAASLLKSGNRLVFEMTIQDSPMGGNFKSRSMIVSTDAGFKGFINAGLNFVSNQLDYTAMAAIAGRTNASNLTKAAAVFVGALEGKGTAITLGCFDATGAFTAQSSN